MLPTKLMLCLALRYINRSGHQKNGRQILGASSLPKKRSLRQQSSMLASINYSKTDKMDDRIPLNDGEVDIDQRLEFLNNEITMLNGGEPVNPHSPKQVALALFGTTQSTSKAVLEKAAKDQSLFPQQRQMASMVLEYRSLRAAVSSGNSQSELQEAISSLSSPGASDDQTVSLSKQNKSLTAHIGKANLGSTVDGPLDWNDPTSYDRLVEAMFADSSSRVNPFWKDSLLQLTRPSARALVKQLSFHQCPMGYDPTASPIDQLKRPDTSTTTAGSKGSFLAYCREQKERYPNCIVVTRCGDFYETFGIDAILLVEHCGLNAMAGKAKAGCPIRNIQATLDCLTEAGYRVAVYEEGTDTDSSTVRAKAGAKSRIKYRFLSAIVSPASPTYLYDLVLLSNAADSLSSGPQSRPYVGIIASNSGYSFAEVSVEEQTVRISERLTAEAVACRIAAHPPADPLIYVPMHGDQSNALPFLPSSGPRIRTKTIPPSLVQQEGQGICEVERVKQIVISELLKAIESQEEDRTQLSAADFTLLNGDLKDHTRTHTSPLYVETAAQLGLMNDPTIPCLVSYLLPTSAPVTSKRFLRRLLLSPPPSIVGEALSSLVSYMKAGDGPALPPFTVPPLGKVLSMIRAGQASAQVYSELLRAMQSTILVIELMGDTGSFNASKALMTVLEYESGMAAIPQSLRARCIDAIAEIESVLCPIHHTGAGFQRQDDMRAEHVSDFGDIIPHAFFERNEATWRGRVRQDAAEEAYAAVSDSAKRLAEVVARDFWGFDTENQGIEELSSSPLGSKTPIVQDIFNNIFALKDIPPKLQAQSPYIHPRDRFGKQIKNRYTTAEVEEALSDYVAACDRACKDVSAALVELSCSLHDKGHFPAIVQACHANLILATTFYHAVKANSLGWNIGKAVDEIGGDDISAKMVNVWPYWMDKNTAVNNTFDLSGMWVLTAPNMSGKSTIMRSTAAAALLTICGLCAPLHENSWFRRFDNLFVRGASADIPTEGKSAFGAEMGDVAAMLRCCGERSLVFVDELGRGTSPKDGTRLAAAVLEAMARVGISGIFATHLHGIVTLPLQSDRIYWKRMAVENATEGCQSEWTYRLEDGVCTDSMALTTALRFGLPRSIIDRAEAFSDSLSNDNQEQTMLDGEIVNDNVISLSDVKTIMQYHCPQRIVELQPGWNAPASFDGKTTLYILELLTNPRRYYVGETDNIHQRLKQHRAKGERWAKSTALLSPVEEGKTAARSLESTLIRQLSSSGVPMQSIFDGRTTRADRRI